MLFKPTTFQFAMQSHLKMCYLINLSLLLLALVHAALSFCYLGNPQWKGVPVLQPIDHQSLVVNWTGAIFNAKGDGRDCTDNFKVKWWPVNQPSNYSMSQLLAPTQRHFRVEALQMEHVDYAFQVIAREDKGTLGIDYNRSPIVYLQRKKKQASNTTIETDVPDASEHATNSVLMEILQRLKSLEKQVNRCQNSPVVDVADENWQQELPMDD